MNRAPGFQGVIGRSAAESVPHWDPLPVPPDGTANVVVILLDDMGFAHLGCYGSAIDTPNVDRLAAGGLRYTNFHVAPVCSPTRASLLTGRNHHSIGMRSVANFDTGFPNMRGAIPASAATLAEMLRPHGVATFMVGKWHLAPGHECSAAGPFHNWPLARGFDRFYGFLGGETDQFRPEVVRGNEHVEPPATPSEGYHLSEDLVDRAIGYVHDHTSITPERPFFLYCAFGATHAPHQAPDAYRQKYRGRFDEGWDVVRERTFARQIELGIVPHGTTLPERNPGVRPWSELSEPEQRFAARLQESYAAFLDHTDAQIGRLIDALDDMEILDNTIVMVLSDNGASQEGGARGVFDEMKFFQGIEQDLDEALARLDDLGGPDSHPNYPWGWSMAGNTPLKRYKQNTHGGGVRSPLVVHWPAGIGDRGGIRSAFGHAIDITPTLLEVLDVEPPATLNGTAQQPMHGASLRTTFDDPAAPAPRSTQYFEMFGHRALYHDGWKAIAYHDQGTPHDDDVWELYRLDDDFSEAHDLAALHPEKCREMVERWWVEAGRYDVLPLDDRAVWQLVRPPLRGSPTGRSRFVYRPPLSHLPIDVCPPHGPRPFSIEADIVVPDAEPGAGTDGALLNRGTINGGYALFVLDGHLVFDLNRFHHHARVRSPHRLEAGPRQVGVHVTDRGGGEGWATLSVDGVEVASGEVGPLMRTLSSLGMDIGRANAPVCDDYEAPFAYAGTIHRLVFEIAPPPSPGSAHQRAGAESAARIELGLQ
jgi:arylsulfatase A-like enzyme